MFDCAVAGLAAHAPDEQLTCSSFTNEQKWTLAPHGSGYMAEYLVRREKDRTVTLLRLRAWVDGTSCGY
ncbi:hypothetical protein [Streptomyces sp. NPDC087538]|uniref:hypothetical protein n=1 Tax=Streptomyces sp. NPDC087538 TaxID=3365797 RepID=UPI003817235F